MEIGQVILMLLAGVACGSLAFVIGKFVIDVALGKYRTGYEEKKK